jgi:hypothetical protein
MGSDKRTHVDTSSLLPGSGGLTGLPKMGMGQRLGREQSDQRLLSMAPVESVALRLRQTDIRNGETARLLSE